MRFQWRYEQELFVKIKNYNCCILPQSILQLIIMIVFWRVVQFVIRLGPSIEASYVSQNSTNW